jgi:Tfp pilus assembly protein PilE
MIKVFLQKHKAVFITIIVTSILTASVAYGHSVIKNERAAANRQIEDLKQSMEKLQVAAEKENSLDLEKQEERKEPEKELVAPIAPVQKEQPVEKNVEVLPIEIEEAEEKTVPCLTYADTTIEVTEDECAMIKQKNERSAVIDEEHQECVSYCSAAYRASVPVTSESQYDSVFGVGSYDNKVSECRDKKDDCEQNCLKTRNNQMKKLWK